MPTTNLTKYCCVFVRVFPDSANCPNIVTTCDGNNFEVNILSITSGNNFGMWSDAEIKSRACGYAACNPSVICTSPTRPRVTRQVDIGCIPKSLLPLQVNFELLLNGVVVETWNINTGSPGSAFIGQGDCPTGTCDEFCT